MARHPLVPAPGRRPVPARERRVRGPHRRPQRDRRGRADHRGAAPRQRQRRQRTDDDIRRSYAAERYTLCLRTVWYAARRVRLRAAGRGDAARRRLVLPRGLGDARPGHRGHAVHAAAVTRSTGCCRWLDELQVGAASLARLLGVGRGAATTARPPARGPGRGG